MILCFDSYYFNNQAKTVCLSFNHWTDETPVEILSEILVGVVPYQSGEFYKRELPCILSLIKKVNLADIEAIVVDGYVHLDDVGKLGLGGYLYFELGAKIPIIGMAKNDFAKIQKLKIEVLRGESEKPLYVTSVGMEITQAASKLKSMHGSFRIPTLLKQLDMLTKENG